ncbi:FliM/FliN family flagellar motor switch protein [Thalassoglobus sp. JC818]|uniref:FliM/FliN family flagellar motor switch protein n=1 Tax=Thalassoglobus sp. JC818 TaxID=3232136 RepID=UPI0034575DCB
MSNNISIDQPVIEPADFDKPRRPKQVLFKMLNQWLAETAARVTESWMSVCTHRIQLGAQSIEIVGDESARKSLPEEGYAIAISIGPEESTGFLCVEKTQLWMLLADLLDLNPDALPHDRSPTQTERSMLEILIEMYVSGLAAAWPGRGDLTCRFEELIERPHRKRISTAHSTWIKGTQTVTSRFGISEIFWLFPNSPIEEIVEDSVDSGTSSGSFTAGSLVHITEQIPFVVTVELGELSLSMTEITDLNIGDILLLDQSVHQPLSARIQGQNKWKGRPVRRGHQLAFQVSEVVSTPARSDILPLGQTD